MCDNTKEILSALSELLENVELENNGVEEHDFFTDHDSNDGCVLCKAREVVDKYSVHYEDARGCVCNAENVEKLTTITQQVNCKKCINIMKEVTSNVNHKIVSG